MSTQYYTFSEAMTALKITRNTLKARMADGDITGRKIGGQWHFTEDEINALANRVDRPEFEHTNIVIMPKTMAARRKHTNGYIPQGKG